MFCKKSLLCLTVVCGSLSTISYSAQMSAESTDNPGTAAAAAAISPVSKPADVVVYKRNESVLIKLKAAEALAARLRQAADELERQEATYLAKRGTCLYCKEPYDFDRHTLQTWHACEINPLHVAHATCMRMSADNRIAFVPASISSCPGCVPSVLSTIKDIHARDDAYISGPSLSQMIQYSDEQDARRQVCTVQ